ncbi:unnamed protein product, partial [Effrenium voratum]
SGQPECHGCLTISIPYGWVRLWVVEMAVRGLVPGEAGGAAEGWGQIHGGSGLGQGDRGATPGPRSGAGPRRRGDAPAAVPVGGLGPAALHAPGEQR